VSRRARSLAFLVAAIACAVLAATLAGGYGRSLSGQLGELRPVVVAATDLVARRAIGPRLAGRALEVRRVPERFVPPGALSSPAEVLGRAPATDVGAGEYLTAERLRAPRPAAGRRPRLDPGLSPVEIRVSGAAALAAGGGAPGSEVDVVVTTEPGPGGRGRTYVAASGVTLLSLAETGEAGGVGEAALGAPPTHVATLAVRRAQALRLIDAESFARQVRLIPRR
jgi:Flp pilus assembly protein CpaB